MNLKVGKRLPRVDKRCGTFLPPKNRMGLEKGFGGRIDLICCSPFFGPTARTEVSIRDVTETIVIIQHDLIYTSISESDITQCFGYLGMPVGGRV